MLRGGLLPDTLRNKKGTMEPGPIFGAFQGYFNAKEIEGMIKL